MKTFPLFLFAFTRAWNWWEEVTQAPKADTTTIFICDGGDDKQVCEFQCFNRFRLCKQDCIDDSSCTEKCAKKYTVCEIECPCHKNCPEGCPCEGWQCLCEVKGENHAEHLECKKEVDKNWEKCIKGEVVLSHFFIGFLFFSRYRLFSPI